MRNFDFGVIKRFFENSLAAAGSLCAELFSSRHKRLRLASVCVISVAAALCCAAVIVRIINKDDASGVLSDGGDAPQRSMEAEPSSYSIEASYADGASDYATGETAEPSPTPVPTPTMLHRGDSGSVVSEVQSRLMELYYLDIDEPTDYFGQQTFEALQLFQRQHKITVDGVIGEETLSILLSGDAQNYTVDPDVKGFDVSRIQERLKELGYFTGEITQLYGDKTEAAVRAFQKRNGLTVDARVGIQTRDMLFSPNAKPAEKHTSAENYKKPTGSSATSALSAMISAAKDRKGNSYVRGAEGPSKFDCSGFVYYCLRKAGIKTGRLNAAGFSQVSSWTKVTSTGKLKKGDLIFWRSPGSSRVSHTGIYLGGGQFIHASSSKGKVVISSFSDYWRKNFVCGRRPF